MPFLDSNGNTAATKTYYTMEFRTKRIREKNKCSNMLENQTAHKPENH